MENEKQQIELPAVVPVKFLAEGLGVPPAEIIKKLMLSGVLATINESIDFDTAAIIADEFGYEAIEKRTEIVEPNEKADKNIKREKRPPVVTIMGHVDHGKTLLLDTIRKTNIIGTESGGITQHIGAYQTKIEFKENGKKKERSITFLDTPGHEAFSAMRAHGANITDMVILVVAADDGVKPQTVEAISHARAAKVPIIVAINKIDKPEADPDRVKRELSEHKLIPEEWGGKTPMVPVSAKTGTGIEELLEIVVLTADLEDLKAAYDVPGKGMVIESKIQSGKGAVGTVIVQEGTFHQGDMMIYDDNFSRIRFMEDSLGRRIKEAKPSDPVLIAGFKKTPSVGVIIGAVSDEKTAREITEKKQRMDLVRSIGHTTGLGEISNMAKEGKIKELNIVLRADVKGSLDAIKSSLVEISTEDVKVNIISDGVGSVTESDINLALASNAIIIAFRVSTPPSVLKLAETSKIKISKYEIIYELLDDISAALEGMLEPEIIETVVGKMEVIKVFRHEKDKGIVGGKVLSGHVSPGTKIIVYRLDEVVGELKTQAIQIGGEKIDRVEANDECGVSYVGNIKLKPKDRLEFVLVEEKLRSLKKKV
jgi:translation initiation factor IF-2